MSAKRVYTVINYPKKGDTYGRYSGATARQAANKALTKLARLVDVSNNNDKYIVFTIRDLENGREHQFMGTRVRLVQPIVRQIKGVSVRFEYRNVLTNSIAYGGKAGQPA